MISFGKKLALLRKEQKRSQGDLAKALGTSVSVISRYERDEMSPSVETAKKLIDVLGTTAAYLLGETETDDLLKDPAMLERLRELHSFTEAEQEQVIFALDAMIREVKNRRVYAG